jgi:GT2 family glycosyltransferase
VLQTRPSPSVASRLEATVSVVVTTYRRVDALRRCLEGIRAQTRPADEVIVVAHESDPESAAFVGEWEAVRLVTVRPVGSVAAYNAGLAAARQEIVAFIDDDAVPTPEWLRGLVATFALDDEIAAVGGRDVVFANGRSPGLEDQGIFGKHRGAPRVGRIQWFGRQIGNHHIGIGEPRDVDVLKGVNMSFRRTAVVAHGFDPRLRGDGAQVHAELSICLPLRRAGRRLVYDPRIVVHHFPAPRPRGDHRIVFASAALRDAAHNEALQVLDHLSPLRRLAFAAWALAIGTREAPGLVNLMRTSATRTPDAGARFVAAQRGRMAAWQTWRKETRS